MNASEATRQLLRRLALNLHNFGHPEIELKLVLHSSRADVELTTT